jgi:hypothetical protein
MAKLGIQRLLEASKLKATEAGQQLGELIDFVNDLADNFVRALRNGLTFQDNFNCLVSTVSVKHGESTVVNTGGKRPYGIIPIRVVSESESISSLSWYIDQSNRTNLSVSFTGAPSEAQSVVIIILFQ